MCVLCEQYSGEHSRWYLNPANYARRLYKLRRDEAEASGVEGNPSAGVSSGGSGMGEGVGTELMLAKARGDQEAYERIMREANERYATRHFAQVVTLEEAIEIADLAYPIVRMKCACRMIGQGATVREDENVDCFGIGPGLFKWERWPNYYEGGVGYVTPDEFKDILRQLNKKGLVHTICTFGTPYVGGFCNCDYPDCIALRESLDYGTRFMMKGHYVAKVNNTQCNGCGLCIKRCQFKALSFSPTRNLAIIDGRSCFGCGLCATVCRQEAIGMLERASFPALAESW